MHTEEQSLFLLIPHAIYADKKLGVTAKFILAEILNLMKVNRQHCWASNSHFAKMLNLTNAAIPPHIKQLVDEEWIFNKVMQSCKLDYCPLRLSGWHRHIVANTKLAAILDGLLRQAVDPIQKSDKGDQPRQINKNDTPIQKSDKAIQKSVDPIQISGVPYTDAEADNNNIENSNEKYSTRAKKSRDPSEIKKWERKAADKQTIYDRICYYYEDLLDTKITFWPKQMTAIKKMLQAGYTEKQIKFSIKYLKTDEFYDDKSFDLMTVANQIPKIKAKFRKDKLPANYVLPEAN